jgi:hypothetical protein
MLFLSSEGEISSTFTELIDDKLTQRVEFIVKTAERASHPLPSGHEEKHSRKWEKIVSFLAIIVSTSYKLMYLCSKYKKNRKNLVYRVRLSDYLNQKS